MSGFDGARVRGWFETGSGERFLVFCRGGGLVAEEDRFRGAAGDAAGFDVALVEPALVSGMGGERDGVLHAVVEVELRHEARVGLGHGVGVSDEGEGAGGVEVGVLG